ncbi:DegT/DnrJ/EryC1/StrS family aminotransferase [Jejudonia soesokkakensis]|uniref:DegT/DnrJ/EryC1/StrS family aminotransferase n=1 Tax=Jejudonia soesokkakensis TaxID=1323432 RepID=A0ABW2MSI4_9FLAO
MINVTQTFLPPQDEFQIILERAWSKGWMTNRGELVKELEYKLKEYLKVPNIIAMTNGTLPIQIAIKALGLTGEIITPAFSYVATTSSIVWEGCIPVFVDIHPEYLTIDETLIEAAITPLTTAILATHVFGNPCHVEAIEKIAKKHNLKVIYDAAHCFGVDHKGKSIFEYGDVSTCSFHATKLFHTGEGGALVCKPELFDSMYFGHNFGHDGPETFRGLGINAKMSELQAAMGLSVLPYMDKILTNREHVVAYYNAHLANCGLKIRANSKWNFSYYPILFDSERQLLKTVLRLNEASIFPRRYFYPSLDSLNYTTVSKVPVTHEITRRILCLPLSHNLKESDLKRIVDIINNTND